jgi:hypothetical protein
VSRPSRRRGIVGIITALSVLAVPAASWAGGPGVWTKLAAVDGGTATPGMLRTPDGSLHLVWQGVPASNNTHSFGWSTISLTGKLLGTGTVLSGWQSLEPDPQLIRDGSGMRIVFEGGTGTAGCYFDASVFTATSADGSAWTLAQGSLDSHTAGVGNLAATAESDGMTPVALFAGGHLFHVGVDPNCPATAPDGAISQAVGSAASNPAVATDAASGAVWAAWYQGFVKQGYWADQLLPAEGAPIEAPGSAATASQNNQPLQPVALLARPGGGVYMAYCTASATQPCAHIDLWKVGSPSAKVVPGSTDSTYTRLALAVGTAGRLSVVWYDGSKNVIHAIRTNTSVTAFGALRTLKAPANTFEVRGIAADGTFGRLDIVLTDLPSTNNAPLELFQTQSLAGLSLTAKPTKFSHKKAKSVTFNVTDAGQAVAGATVSCLGKKGKSSASGAVKLKFHKGSPAGKHVCNATKALYNIAKITIKVT